LKGQTEQRRQTNQQLRLQSVTASPSCALTNFLSVSLLDRARASVSLLFHDPLIIISHISKKCCRGTLCSQFDFSATPIPYQPEPMPYDWSCVISW
jgi:hypothetical protein